MSPLLLLSLASIVIASSLTSFCESSLSQGLAYWRIRHRMHVLRRRQQHAQLWGSDPSLQGPASRRLMSFLRNVELKQPLDHLDPACNKTFKQRVWVNSLFWKRPRGPVFLYIGGESALNSNDVFVGQHVRLAQSHGALLVAAEHRFYGKSVNEEGLSDKNLRYLTISQALADLVRVHHYVSDEFGLKQGHAWVSFGGSYPGSLSAWFRLKHPELIHTAVASSAPVQAQLDYAGYDEVVGQSLRNSMVGGSDECVSSMREGFERLDKLLEQRKYEEVQNDFEACGSLQKARDRATFVGNLASVVMAAVQYDELESKHNIAEVCDKMTDRTVGEPYLRLAHLAKTHLLDDTRTCVQSSYDEYLFTLQNEAADPELSEMRQWFFQKCSEIGVFQSCYPERGCPFSRLLTLEADVDVCVRVFGLSLQDVSRGVDGTNRVYGANHPDGTRVIFVNGDIDPWHKLSVLKSLSPLLPAIVINGTSHCADMEAPKMNDIYALRHARQEIEKQIVQWLQ
ncbi:thymus-specific serine protease-like isoform X1 [Petromyzon marinus]|uniref:thymus-specific serine protease-like isoform X1 n=2 Tax=Petromyzon marinus TaxID=7757 RepID=UPI003F6EB50B